MALIPIRKVMRENQYQNLRVATKTYTYLLARYNSLRIDNEDGQREDSAKY